MVVLKQKAQPHRKKQGAPRNQQRRKRIKVVKPAKQYNTKKAKKGSKVLKKFPHQKGLKKLPTKVRNKMGYMKKGGRVGMGKAMRGGGCVR